MLTAMRQCLQVLHLQRHHPVAIPEPPPRLRKKTPAKRQEELESGEKNEVELVSSEEMTEKDEEEEVEPEYKITPKNDVTYKDFFKMATLGGAVGEEKNTPRVLGHLVVERIFVRVFLKNENLCAAQVDVYLKYSVCTFFRFM